MASLRGRTGLVIQIAFGAAVVWFAAASLKGNWTELQAIGVGVQPDWHLITISGVLVLGAYFILIEAWRRMLADWDRLLPYGTTARIWFVSNLGRYVPGRILAVGAIAVMARKVGVSPANSVGSSMLVTLINVLAGGALLVGVGATPLLQRILATSGTQLSTGVIISLLAVSIGAVLMLPIAIRSIGGVITRFAGREVAIPNVPTQSILATAAAGTLAWLIYGVAFWVFCRGVLGGISGNLLDYVTVYTASYLAGFIVVFVPGGIVVRESALVLTMTQLELTTAPEALLIAWTSRIWLTVLEVLPGLILLFVRRSSSGATDTSLSPQASDEQSNGR